MDDDQDGGWVNVSFGTGSPGWSRTKGRKTVVLGVGGVSYLRCRNTNTVEYLTQYYMEVLRKIFSVYAIAMRLK